MEFLWLSNAKTLLEFFLETYQIVCQNSTWKKICVDPLILLKKSNKLKVACIMDWNNGIYFRGSIWDNNSIEFLEMTSWKNSGGILMVILRLKTLLEFSLAEATSSSEFHWNSDSCWSAGNYWHNQPHWSWLALGMMTRCLPITQIPVDLDSSRN